MAATNCLHKRCSAASSVRGVGSSPISARLLLLPPPTLLHRAPPLRCRPRSPQLHAPPCRHHPSKYHPAPAGRHGAQRRAAQAAGAGARRGVPRAQRLRGAWRALHALQAHTQRSACTVCAPRPLCTPPACRKTPLRRLHPARTRRAQSQAPRRSSSTSCSASTWSSTATGVYPCWLPRSASHAAAY